MFSFRFFFSSLIDFSLPAFFHPSPTMKPIIFTLSFLVNTVRSTPTPSDKSPTVGRRDATCAIVYGDANNRRGCFSDPNFDRRVGWLSESGTFGVACHIAGESGQWLFVSAYNCYTYSEWVNEACIRELLGS